MREQNPEENLCQAFAFINKCEGTCKLTISISKINISSKSVDHFLCGVLQYLLLSSKRSNIKVHLRLENVSPCQVCLVCVFLNVQKIITLLQSVCSGHFGKSAKH